MKKICIVGAGYAGLTCATLLSKQNKFEVTLINDSNYFFNKIQSHLFLTKPNHLFLEIQNYADRFGFKFIKQYISLEEIEKAIQNKNIELLLNGRACSFDSIVFCTGAITSPELEGSEHSLNLENLTATNIHDIRSKITNPSLHKDLVIVGGGATGLQFAFEIKQWLKDNKIKKSVTIVTLETSLLSNYPSEFGIYAHKMAHKNNINIYYQSNCNRIDEEGILIERPDGSQKRLDSNLVFLFPGTAPSPMFFQCNSVGQIIDGKKYLLNKYAVGDNSRYDGDGSNILSAQTAIRKAKTIVESIVNIENGLDPVAYSYKPLGYFISMGKRDGIGWMLNEELVTTGLAAFAIKEIIEKQFDLFLAGIDTYFDV